MVRKLEMLFVVVILLMSCMIAVFPFHVLAAPPAGHVAAWGFNLWSSLGDGTTTDSSTPVHVVGPAGAGYLTGITAIAAHYLHNLALKSDGTVWAWGSNYFGQLGDGTTTDSSTPVQVEGPAGAGYLTDITAIAAGCNHSLALKSDGTVWAWGYNHYGQLGDGTTTDSSTPVQVEGPAGAGYLTGITAIAAGDSHSLALKSDGTVWAWGDNYYDELGDGTPEYSEVSYMSPVPMQVVGPAGAGYLTGITAIAAGYKNNLALKSDGTVWAWGSNYFGQLGDGTTTDSSAPVQVKGPAGAGYLTGITAIASDGGHCLALKSDGTVWAWGDNYYDELGDGTTTNRSTPVQVEGPAGAGYLTGITAIAAGGVHSMALKPDGTVWGWGLNDYGQLGDGTTTNSPTPVQVSGLFAVIGIAAGDHYCLALNQPVTPVISWATPTAITYGTALGSTQLNASAIYNGYRVDGTFAYSPAAGTVLGAGPQTLSVTFTPKDAIDYTLATASVTLQVNQAVLSVEAGSQSMTYGQAVLALTYDITGFVNGDGYSVVSGAPDITTAATSSSPAGFYWVTISQGSLSLLSANYSGFTFHLGSLIINPALTSVFVANASGTYGGTVSLSATLTSNGSGVSGETISFYLANGSWGNSTWVGNSTTDSFGNATLTGVSLTGISVGTYPSYITASFYGDTNYWGSTDNATLTIEQATPVISWATPTAITYGTALGSTQLNARASYNGSPVAGTFAYSPPAGTVLGAGTHTLNVTFTARGALYTPATASVTLQVTQAPLTVTADAQTKVYGQANPTLTASATGLVDGDTLAGLNLGYTLSTTATSTSPVGSYPISFSSGTTSTINYSPITYVPGTLTIRQAFTKTTVTSSANPSVYGQPVTFTATVSVVSPGAGTPIGTVIFRDGFTIIGSVSLSGNTATFTTNKLSAGLHIITAAYGGDANFEGSLWGLIQMVNKANTSTAVASSINPSVFGQSVTFTATVKATALGPGTPTDTVTFKDSGKVLSTKALDGSGKATFTTNSLSVGTHSINAVYGGDSNFNGSTSPTLTQVVNRK